MAKARNRPISVLLVEDDTPFRQGLCSLLRANGIHVVGEVEAIEEGVAATAEHRPDVVVVGLGPGRPPSIEALGQYVRARSSAVEAVELPADLNERELAILRLLAEGRNNAEIAAELFLSVGTVKAEIGVILHRLNVKNRVQAAVLAVRSGLA